MTAWLYQMTTEEKDGEYWSPEEYRLQVWEGDNITWGTRKITCRNQDVIRPGDLVILMFCKSHTEDHGIYGWGVIQKFNPKKEQITFTPTSPSDFLKTSPAWDDSIENLANQIRAPQFQGTMWDMTLEELNAIRAAIRHHLGPTMS